MCRQKIPAVPVLVLPKYSFSDDITIYGLAGYGNTKIDYQNGLVASTTDENSMAYGIGAEYTFEANNNGHKWSL